LLVLLQDKVDHNIPILEFTLLYFACNFEYSSFHMTARINGVIFLNSSNHVRFEVFTAVTMKNDASEERTASIIRMTVGEIGTTLAVTSNRKTLR
jgi:hypothetical protein